MGKSDRAFCFGVLGAGVAAGLLPAAWINGVLLLLAALLLLTLVNRVRLGVAQVAAARD
jgi:CDP-diacylglycerol--glycerol-3-phosphate 3-phosphatidyltransferase